MARPIKVRSSWSIPTVQDTPPPTVPDPLRFLQDTGLLYHMNRSVFHPLGLAMVLDNTAAEGWRLLDHRSNPVTTFSIEDLAAGSRKFKDYMAAVGNAVMARRKELLTFVTQT